MEAEVPELRQMHNINEEVWDTAQLAHMNKHNEVDHEMIGEAAFFSSVLDSSRACSRA